MTDQNQKQEDEIKLGLLEVYLDKDVFIFVIDNTWEYEDCNLTKAQAKELIDFLKSKLDD